MWVCLVSLSAAGEPKRVLILNPYSRNVEPFSSAVSDFRSTLAREYRQPLDFQELPLDLARLGGAEGEGPLVSFVEDRIRRQPVDLVVPIGGAGVQFVARHRERLFAQSQILAVAAEPRMVPADFLDRNATLVSQQANLTGFIEDILRLKPDTERIAVVLGSSPMEQYWGAQCRREFKAFGDRVEFVWLDGLPYQNVIDRCSKLPPRSFILHVLLLMDLDGVAFEANEALKQLHQSANAPVFSCFESELGMGAVGGRLIENSRMGIMAARTAVRILDGRSAGDIPPIRLEEPIPRYDWRELHRWNIPVSQLPANSVVLFREPGFWENYRWMVVGTVCFVGIESLLILGLLVGRRKRIQDELEATLIADISSKFVNLPAGEVDQEIMDAQRRICRLLGLDSSVLWQVPEDGGDNFNATHVYQAADDPAASLAFRQEDFPWVRSEMIAGRMVVFATLHELPPAARIDKETAIRFGIKSSLTMPLSVGGGHPLGVLAFNSVRRECVWREPLLERLQLVAQIFANALARRRSDVALQESELRLNLAADSAGAGLWVLEWDSGVFWASENARRIFAYDADEKIDLERFKDSVAPEDWPQVEASISNAVKTGLPVDVEYRIRPDDGGERWIVSRGRPLFKHTGEPMRLVGLSMDITEQKQAAGETLALRDALAHTDRVSMLGHLASALAHELSQPLGAILRNAEAAEIMLSGPAPDLDELRAIVADILHDDQRAGQVIDRLRSLLRLGTLDPRPVDLCGVIEEALSILKADAAARRVRLEFACAQGLPLVCGDRIHLQQVLINLVVNAMDSLAANGSTSGRIRVGVGQPDATTVEVEVADNGPGIPEDALPRLFQPFYTTKAKGMGIGLTISRTIIDAHRGKIWAMNDPAGGARFCFTVPVMANAPVPAAES